MSSTRSARADFDNRANEIVHEWAARRTGQDSTESANAWFKRNAYAFLRTYIEAGKADFFHKIAKHDRRPSRLVEEAMSNPFKLGLLAMFADESLKRSDRHVFGNQMLYAYLHDVPSEFLNGFLAVSGGPGVIARKLKEDFVEPGFETKVHRQLPKVPIP